MNRSETAQRPQYPHNPSYRESAGARIRHRAPRARAVAAIALVAAACGPVGPRPDPTTAAGSPSSSPRRTPAVSSPVAAGTTAVSAVGPGPSTAATCVASFYGEAHRGRATASGAPFNPDALTAASWHHPFGTRLQVTHDDRTVVVTVNDRGPAHYLGRCIDLSRAAFARLADLGAGLIDVHVARVAEGWS